jgi:xanthine dehydrogenase accessory factor
MKEILGDLDRWQREDEEIALATLVRLRGSAPRLPGARLCLTRSGKMVGSVSGGCVENEVYERAMRVLDSAQPELVSYGIADEMGFEVGLSCGGSIDVLIEPFSAGDVWKVVRQALEDQQPAALSIGLSPGALLGRKLAVGAEDALGSIDPSLDQEVAAQARRLLLNGGTRVLTLPWRGEQGSIFIEAFPPPSRLFIVGATHTAMPLCRMAKGLGFRVSVIDARSTFATGERFPEADELQRAWPDDALHGAVLDAYAYVVVLTHDPKFDLPTLALALRSQARYIGVIGSRVTHERREAELRQRGFTEGDLARIRAPIGLDIGARTPEEIAVAILAEMLAVRYGRDGRPLRERRAPIRADD